MNKKIFRQKNVDRLSSPEELNDYIKVTNPGVWMALLAIIVLLIGLCTWAFLGRIDTKVVAVAITDENNATACYIEENQSEKLKVGQEVYIEEETYMVSTISEEHIQVSEDNFSAYARQVADLQVGDCVHKFTLNKDVHTGILKAEVLVESISPWQFIVN